MPEEMLAPVELSKKLGIPESTLAQWRYLGRGPRFLKLGGHVRYRVADVASWLASCERGTPDAAA